MTLSESGQSAAEAVGIHWREVPADGRWHEVPAEGKGHRNSAGRIRLFHDGEGGQVWNHITGDSITFWTRSEATLDPVEREARRQRAVELREQAEAERQRAAEAAASLAAALWKAGRSAEGNPYLDRKGVAAVDTLRQIDAGEAGRIIGYAPRIGGEELTGPLLLAPIKSDGRWSSVQIIAGDGRKYFLPGGVLKGGFWATGPMPPGNGEGLTVYLTEGVATALSVHEGKWGLVLAGMSCGNLPAVARWLRDKYPHARIVICSDRGNGEDHARRAAVEVGALLAVPVMDGDGTDFNDLHKAAGLDEVRRQIDAAAPLKPSGPLKPGGEFLNETPLLFDEINTPEIPADMLPGWLGEYAGAVAKSTQTPEAMAVMLGLSTVATCASKRFEVSPYSEGYTEPLNIWTATALPPASRKTAVTSAMTGPLAEFEQAEAERLAPEIKRTAAKRRTLEKRRDKLEKDAANSDDPARRDELLAEIERVEAEMPEEIHAPRLWTGDTTPERLQGLLADHGEKMAVLSDEGGIFEVMAGLYSDGRANLDIFLQGHAGKSVRVDRLGRIAHLDAPALTFGLAIQPAILADMGNGGKRRFRGNGTLARFIYAIPRSNIGTRNVRENHPIPATVAARYRAGLFDLLAIPRQIIDNRETARRLTLTLSALDSWQAFAQWIEERQGEGGDLEPIQDWSGKLPGAALRIAGNFHLVEHGGNPPAQIEQATVEKALDLCTLLIDHAKAAFGLMDADPVTADAKAIFKWIESERLTRFRRGEAYRQFKGRFTGKAERLDKAIKDLEARAIVTATTEATAGRSATVFMVNPVIWRES